MVEKVLIIKVKKGNGTNGNSGLGLAYPATIRVFSGGVIAGGGGGGGGGGGAYDTDKWDDELASGGGGGGGAANQQVLVEVVVIVGDQMDHLVPVVLHIMAAAEVAATLVVKKRWYRWYRW